MPKTFTYKGQLYEVVEVSDWRKRKRGTAKQKGQLFKLGAKSGKMKGAKKSKEYKPTIVKPKVVKKPIIIEKPKPIPKVIAPPKVTPKEEEKVVEKKGLKEVITRKEKKKAVRRAGKTYHIDPLVRKLWDDYKGSLTKGAKLEETKKKMLKGKRLLPIGALQKWYEARRNFYEINGVQRDVFDDKISNMDMAGLDGWGDLDSRLATIFNMRYKSFKEEYADHLQDEMKIERQVREYEEEKREAERKKSGAVTPKPSSHGIETIPMNESFSKYVRKWKVPSHSNPNNKYVVSETVDGKFECGCRKWTSTYPREDCKHILDLRSELGENA